MVLLIIMLAFAFSCRAEEVNLEASFNQFDGYEVKFDYENYSEEREIAYLYYLKKYGVDEFQKVQRHEIGIDLYDLDDNGEKEIFAYLNNGGFCGSAGCRFNVLKNMNEPQKISGERSQSIIGLNAYSKIKILKSKNLGFADLMIYDKRGVNVWSWNGKVYEILKEIEETTWGKQSIYNPFRLKRIERSKNELEKADVSCREEERAERRKINIADLTLNIPRTFLMGDSGFESRKEEKGIMVSVPYLEEKVSLEEENSKIYLWIEDIAREKNAMENLGNKSSKIESNIIEIMEVDRVAMIESLIKEPVPFDLKYISRLKKYFGDYTPIDCDSEIYLDRFCKAGFFYKNLFILMVFNNEWLGNFNNVQNYVLNLIKQWEFNDQI